MSTEKQIEANRRNCHKSTGPRTVKGKAKAARNAFKHGLRCKSTDVIIGRETIRQYNNFYQVLFEDLAPVGPRETILADRIIILSWKLKRIARLEKQTFTILVCKACNSNSMVKHRNDLVELKKEVPQSVSDAANWVLNNGLGEMAISNFASHSQTAGRTLENIQNFESRIERSLYIKHNWNSRNSSLSANKKRPNYKTNPT